MYRKRRQNKRGGWPEFLDQALEEATKKASALTQPATDTMGSLQSATTGAMDLFKEKTNALATEASVIPNMTPSPVSEGGKSRRKRKTKRKRTKRSSVRQRR